MNNMEKIITKKIECYMCGRTGVANQEERFYGGIGKKKAILIWTSKTWKQISSKKWLCPKCAKKKCKRCLVLLSNTKVCDEPHCGQKHGAYYIKHPKYCKKCWNEIKETNIK